MDGNFNKIHQLLQERADYQARLNLIPYDIFMVIIELVKDKYHERI